MKTRISSDVLPGGTAYDRQMADRNPLPEVEQALRRDGDYHGPNDGRRLARSAVWFSLVVLGLGAGVFLVGRTAEKPTPPKPISPRVAELRVVESKAISPHEELRVVWMPDQFDVMGYRCLLYTNTQTGASALSCPGNSSLAPDDPEPGQ